MTESMSTTARLSFSIYTLFGLVTVGLATWLFYTEGYDVFFVIMLGMGVIAVGTARHAAAVLSPIEEPAQVQRLVRAINSKLSVASWATGMGLFGFAAGLEIGGLGAAIPATCWGVALVASMHLGPAFLFRGSDYPPHRVLRMAILVSGIVWLILLSVFFLFVAYGLGGASFAKWLVVPFAILVVLGAFVLPLWFGSASADDTSA